MSQSVAILEDDAGRVLAMRDCLAELLPGVQVVVFDHAERMVEWLDSHLGEVVLISLDHDLPVRRVGDMMVDCGTGRRVADFLASLQPTCPIIVHSSNNDCAPGMLRTLRDARWPVSRVYPSDGDVWVRAEWAQQVRAYVRDGWIKV